MYLSKKEFKNKRSIFFTYGGKDCIPKLEKLGGINDSWMNLTGITESLIYYINPLSKTINVNHPAIFKALWPNCKFVEV